MLRTLTPSHRAKLLAIGLLSSCRQTRICWNKRLSNLALGAIFATTTMLVMQASDAKIVAKKTPTNQQKFVNGILFGSPFQMVDAFVSPRKLLIRTAPTANRSGVTNIHLKYRQYIELTFPEAEKLEGQTFAFKSYEREMQVGSETQSAPTLMICALINNYSEVIRPTEPYTLVLSFYKSAHGMLPGSIVLQSNGVKKIDLRGYFYAKLTP